ncbi:MAG TPA: hypothetical protein VGM88_29490 [Kofleriaceae bacterium]|jgi:hypothetical protein
MTSVWGNEPGAGAFVLFDHEPADRPGLCIALLDALVSGLELDPKSTQISVSDSGNWRSFSRTAIEKTLATPGKNYFSVLVGTSQDVQLGARVQFRHKLGYPTRSFAPPHAWFVARQRWPKALVRDVARRWFTLAAEQGTPISGGASGDDFLPDLKAELSFERESSFVAWESVPPRHSLFWQRLDRDHEWYMHDRIRRLYPLSLLGPRFATARNEELLRTAGATVERVRESLLVTAYPDLISVWSPAYLAATARLRKLAWPISIQNAADLAGLRMRPQFAVRRSSQPFQAPYEAIVEEFKTQTQELERLLPKAAVAALPEDKLEFAPGWEPEIGEIPQP